VETTGPGFFVLSNVFYPGWEVRVNGREMPVLKAYGLFQAVYVPEAGQHTIEFIYRPYRGAVRSFEGLFKKEEKNVYG